MKQYEWTLYRNQLKSDVTKYLGAKLAKKLNVSHIKVPWSRMKAEDLINWPQEVRFVPIRKMNIIEIERLHRVVQENLLDFTPEFISQFKPSRGSTTPVLTRIRDMDQLKSDFTTYLGSKLAKKLNVSSIKVPWFKMKAEDIINWPQEVRFVPIHMMDLLELRRLNKLAKEDLLDFTPEFVSNFKSIRSSRNSEKFSLANDLRSDVTKYLGSKLAKKLNVSHIKVPWSRMKAEDLINWPPDVEFKPVYNMALDDLKRLHKLVEANLLDFSSQFLAELKPATPKYRVVQEIIRDIETVLCHKLNAGTNKRFKGVPWTLMQKENIINWPKGIPFVKPLKQKKKDLKVLHKLREVFSFSKDFLKALSDPRFDKTHIGRGIIQ
jgi:hypothetical protein